MKTARGHPQFSRKNTTLEASSVTMSILRTCTTTDQVHDLI